MPFYTPSNKPEFYIDFNKYKPIYVYFYTDMDGNIRPLQFTYETDDNTRVTLKINEVQYTKDIQGGILFCCLVTNYGRQQEVDLVFFYKQHICCMMVG